MSDIDAPPAPWHHWPVSVLSMAFYALLSADYAFTKLGLDFWVGRLDAEQQAFVAQIPLWLSAVWAIAAWGGLAGAWLLFRQRRASVLLLFLSMALLGLLTVWMTLFSRPTVFALTGFEGFYLLVGSVAMALLVYLYARWERTEAKLA